MWYKHLAQMKSNINMSSLLIVFTSWKTTLIIGVLNLSSNKLVSFIIGLDLQIRWGRRWKPRSFGTQLAKPKRVGAADQWTKGHDIKSVRAMQRCVCTQEFAFLGFPKKRKSLKQRRIEDWLFKRLLCNENLKNLLKTNIVVISIVHFLRDHK